MGRRVDPTRQHKTGHRVSNFLHRFWDRVDVTSPSECWLWTGAKNRGGYGQLSYRTPRGNGTLFAHRFAYEATIGLIPQGLQIDHLCRVRACVNPSHLEPVTAHENLRRSTVWDWERCKTHCPKGHPYDEANTVMHHGSRECRTCKNINQKRTRLERMQQLKENS